MYTRTLNLLQAIDHLLDRYFQRLHRARPSQSSRATSIGSRRTLALGGLPGPPKCLLQNVSDCESFMQHSNSSELFKNTFDLTWAALSGREVSAVFRRGGTIYTDWQ